jgi:uncharacterized OB-fold protein
MHTDFDLHYGPQEHHVYAMICPACGKRFYPSVMICDACHTRRNPLHATHPDPRFPAWEEEILEGTCTLLTWTQVFALPEGFDRTSLDFCIVDFPNKLRASGRLNVENPEIGMRLVAHVDIVNQKANTNNYGFIFSQD